MEAVQNLNHGSIDGEGLKGLLAAIVESSDDAIISETFDSVITSWNSGAEKIFGFSAAEAVGQNISLITPSERLQEDHDVLAKVRKGKQVKHFETIRIKKDKQRIDINLTVSPILNSTGEIIGVSNIAQDITARREVEQLRNLLTTIIESSDIAITTETLDHVITAWNKGAERIFGYSPTEVIGRHSSLIVPAESLKEVHDILSQVRKGKKIEHFKTERIRKDGKHIDIDLTVSPILDSARRIIGFSSVAQDITARQEIEEKSLFYMQELEKYHRSMSEYAGTMAHDLKAPLRHIMQYCELLKEEVATRLDTSGIKYVDKLIVSTQRLQQLVDDLMSYAQSVYTEEEKQELDFNKAVQNVLECLDFMVEESHASIKVGNLPVMSVYPSGIRQLFRNLIINAIKYRSEKDPLITIEGVDKGTHYQFSVRDNGIGIPKDHHESIFQPFKRLHRQEEIEGTGLGLSICTRIIEMHKGRIWVESTLGEGATFFFTIPKQ